MNVKELKKLIKLVINEQKEFSEIRSKVDEWNSEPCYKDCVDKRMDEANEMLGGFGVAVYRDEDSSDRYYGDIVLLYVNMGDTYDETVIYDIHNEEFVVASLGDYVEEKGYYGDDENLDTDSSDYEYDESDTDDDYSRVVELAKQWHGGQWSPLYSFASTGEIRLPIEDYLEEIDENLDNISKKSQPNEYKQLLRMKIFFLKNK